MKKKKLFFLPVAQETSLDDVSWAFLHPDVDVDDRDEQRDNKVDYRWKPDS
jgi:hypothetical protein